MRAELASKPQLVVVYVDRNDLPGPRCDGREQRAQADAAQTDYGGGRLAYRPIADPISPAHYGLAMPKNYVPTRIVQAFVDECRRVLRQEDAAAKFFVRPDGTN
ncbi:MAG: hypothetical protein V3S40_01165 [Kiloniellales bacterium]